MTDEALVLTEAQIDYLRELTNIGTGNAAGTLSFVLRRPVDTRVPKIQIGRVSEITALFGHQGTPLMGIRLALTGDVKGSLFFFLAEQHRRSLVEMVRQRTAAQTQASDETILILVSQMVATSNLNAIKRFCGLYIHHSEPVLETNLFQVDPDGGQALLIETTFIIDNDYLRTYLLLLPDRESLQALVSSIDYVSRMILGTP